MREEIKKEINRAVLYLNTIMALFLIGVIFSFSALGVMATLWIFKFSFGVLIIVWSALFYLYGCLAYPLLKYYNDYIKGSVKK